MALKFNQERELLYLNKEPRVNFTTILKAKKKFSRKKPELFTESIIAALAEPKSPDPSITIHNFDEKGYLINPIAPTLATSIDPNYLADTHKRKPVKKFLLGTDRIKLREIARTKYMLWFNKNIKTQKMYEDEVHNAEYMEMKEFCNFCNQRLDEMEREAFRELRDKQTELEELNNDDLTLRRRELELETQKISMEVLNVYERFKYLLKLINYFDQVGEEIDENNKLKQILHKNNFDEFLLKFPSNHSQNELKQFNYYVNDIILPYLEKHQNLNSDMWFKGYKNIQKKIFNFTTHLTRVSLLNYAVEIIFDKFMKSNELKTKKRVRLINSDVLKRQSQLYESRAYELLWDWEQKQKLNKVSIAIEANSEALIKKLEVYETSKESNEQNNLLENITYEETQLESDLYTDTRVIENIGRIQNCLFPLLQELDVVPVKIRKKCERIVREKMLKKEIQAKKSLLEECRIKNLIHHFEYHFKTDGTK